MKIYALRTAMAAALAVGAASGGCATKVPAPLIQARPAQARETIFDVVLRRFARMYIDPAAIDPSAMLAGAVSELAATVPELNFHTFDRVIELEVAGRRTSLSRQVSDLDELYIALDAAPDWLRASAPPAEPPAFQTPALRGAVRSVDRWGNVLYGHNRDAFMSRFRGSMAGVGCRIGRRDGVVQILDVYPGSPAARSGLQKGDHLVAIDGESVEEENVSRVVERLRGRSGERVFVRIRRPPQEPEIDLAVTRSHFIVPTVSSRIVGGNVGYLRISHIAKNSGVVAKRLLGGLRESNSLMGIVLDLRGNTGGSLLAAGYIADQFVDDGILIETRGRNGQPVPTLRHRIDATTTDPPVPQTALVILVDSGTASSAEFLAAALVRHDRAILVGQRTFGKGVLQKTYNLGAGNEVLLKVTVARAYAAGDVIPEAGMVPDIILEPGNSGAPSVACADTTAGAIAAVTLAATTDELGDPRLSFAIELVHRYPAHSRMELRRLIQRDFCPQA